MSYAKDSAIRAKRFTEFQELYKKKSMDNYDLSLDNYDVLNIYEKPTGIQLFVFHPKPTPSCLALYRSRDWNNFSKKYLKQKTMNKNQLIMHLFCNRQPWEIINMYQVIRSTSSFMDGVPEWAVKEFLIASNHSSQDPKEWIHTYKWPPFWD